MIENLTWEEEQAQDFETWWLKKYGATGPFKGMEVVNQAVKDIAKEAWLECANLNWRGD